MASLLKNLSEHNIANSNIAEQAKNWQIGIIVADYNEKITYALFDACCQTLKNAGVLPQNLHIAHAPGAYELPLTALWLLQQFPSCHAVICLGCVIKGDTDHDIYINNAISQGIMQLNLTHAKPVIFGVLTTNNLQQALDRAGGKHGNKGVEAAFAALKMLETKTNMTNK
ncbi:MAG: 6,7-dimethyl-8-ribityllumazine synthase [Sphingobacteriales bacterium]|jgi:6,7-dimethyl-8-ribityllumazine synthase|nr:6,7-dimethyl-8-ribityllumazine synthase [Sphingobacteriales bacterium]MBP9140045.1 6,7-dimethyl-8-ribityllumazine synthase [Chitinophagales bacterium]MDA0199104.1 6,7-dimethyl-8-ribityllumazine synthase [Bacteroidota bacterium]MBK6889901.1 6,7-dimethyl-8-ribityllumazine synthase [Sphingobacteriales bacterium]MBK7527578.1 6,7-dimethyl-8-ribityllumazine synthase [Sphingobacteriales bacterium]